MVSSIALSKNIPFEHRTELALIPDDILATTVRYEPITLAALPPSFAFGALAIVAAVLDSLEAPGRASYTWEQDGIPPVMDTASFTAWLSDNGQNRLWTSPSHEDEQGSAVVWAAGDWAEMQAGWSAEIRTRPAGAGATAS